MRTVLDYIDRKQADCERLPLFEFMGDESIPARDRLGFVPALAHFVLTFSDLYAHVLREEPPRDTYQELVNAHTYEDGGHWKWFLADLVALGEDPSERVTDTLRRLWSPETLKTRMLSYRICRLGLNATSLERLVLVHCIEAVGKVTLKHVAPIGRSLASQLTKPLVYFGPHHLDTESAHTLEERDVRSVLEQDKLSEEQRIALRAIVDETFKAFEDGSHDLCRFARARMAGSRMNAGSSPPD